MRVPLSWLREYVDLPATETGRDVQAKLVSAGLEVETVAYGRIGERNAARLVALGRDDLLRVGDRPGDGWSRVHLTAAGRERMGGDAWLDRRAVDAVAADLLPLYREPGRHTAQQVLSAGTTVMVRVTTRFGQPDARDEWLTLRLTGGGETARIGEITVVPTFASP